MRAGTDWGPAQEAMAELLAKFAAFDLEAVTDINISNHAVSVRIAGASQPTEIEVEDIEVSTLASLMASALELEISGRKPILEKRLPPRYRLSFSHPAVTQDGSWDLSIRFLPTQNIPIGDYIEKNSMDLATAERLVELAQSRKTMVIAGPTGSGKSTLLRSIIHEIPVRDRIVVIESGPELNISRPNMSAMADTDDATFEDLIAHTLRKDPDIIIVGEVRGREAARFMTIAAAGHPCMTTIHSDAGPRAFIRLLRMIRLAEPHFDRAELEEAVHAVCYVSLDPNTGQRKVELWEPEAA